MKPKRIATSNRVTTIAFIVLGIAIVLYGLAFNVSHIDNYLDAKHSFFESYAVPLGYLLIVIAPLFVRKYIWSLVLLGIAAIFVAWVYISQALQ